ncbi:MAG: bifunctional phosphoribosyl-AMP cyclohydrolase/phosphoribosyl-ATP diphosphatase HisIE [Chloroflexota bacterium]
MSVRADLAGDELAVTFDDEGLIPAVVQDVHSGQVLTLAYMNEEALRRTLEGPDAWFYSRSRGELWHKGETSGNYLRVSSVALDCDGDALVVQVEATGPACHTGQAACFYTPLDTDSYRQADLEEKTGPGELQRLFSVIEDRRQHPAEGSYTASLFEAGLDRIAQKVVEEAGETAIASLRDDPDRLSEEIADLLYHSLVLMSEYGLHPSLVWRELRRRRK